jgi:choline dehydrogenase-like flavoprotein
MLVEASELGDRQVLETDLCVIGAGAAGITMARALTHSGIDVTLLESGGFEFDEGSQALYAGEVSGNVLRPGFAGDYLLRSRLRYFGGTTNHWSGFCLPLEPDDFAVRDWIPESGWPFDADALQPFYGEAARVCEIDDFDYDPVAALRQMQPDHAILDRGPVRTRLIHRSTTRFGKSYRKELVETPTIRVVTGANVTELRLDAGRAVGSVHAATLGGREFTVRARAYVLACGSIENARLLLASNQQRPRASAITTTWWVDTSWNTLGG